ncbi:MAG: hypothetical protein RI897_3386 [Verrucomicrobiota bacterium]|jgi:hypothetical protein
MELTPPMDQYLEKPHRLLRESSAFRRDSNPQHEWAHRRPTEKEWQDFWRMCEGFGVWSWPEAPDEINVYDGPTMRLFFQTADRYVRADSGFRSSTRRRQIQLIHAALTRMTLQRDPTPEDWRW